MYVNIPERGVRRLSKERGMGVVILGKMRPHLGKMRPICAICTKSGQSALELGIQKFNHGSVQSFILQV